MTGHGPCRNRLTSSWLSRPASGSELVVSKPSCVRPGACGRVCCSAAGWFRHGPLVPHGPAQPAPHTTAPNCPPGTGIRFRHGPLVPHGPAQPAPHTTAPNCPPGTGIRFRHGPLVPHGPAQPASHTKAGPARFHDPAPHGKIERSVDGGPATSGPAHLGVFRGVGGADDGGTSRQGRHHNHRATGGGVDTELGIEEAVEEVTDAHDSMLRREIPCVQYPFVR